VSELLSLCPICRRGFPDDRPRTYHDAVAEQNGGHFLAGDGRTGKVCEPCWAEHEAEEEHELAIWKALSPEEREECRREQEAMWEEGDDA
jgi:hypothetical protein